MSKTLNDARLGSTVKIWRRENGRFVTQEVTVEEKTRDTVTLRSTSTGTYFTKPSSTKIAE